MKGYILIVLAGAFWGTAGLFVRFLSAYQLNPYYMVLLRDTMAVGMLGSLLLLFWREHLVLRKGDFRWFMLAGFTSVVLSQPSFFTALKLNTLAVALVLNYTAPFFVILLSRLLFKEPITLRKWVALTVSMAGLVLVVKAYDLHHTAVTPLGFLTGLLSGFFYALQTLIMKKLAGNYHPAANLFYTFALGVPMLFIVLLLFQIPMPILLPTNVWLVIAGVGLIPTLVPFLFYATGLKLVEAGKASIAAMAEPLSATLLGFLFLGEWLEPIQAVGMLLVMSGIVIIGWPVNKTTESACRCQMESDVG